MIPAPTTATRLLGALTRCLHGFHVASTSPKRPPTGWTTPVRSRPARRRRNRAGCRRQPEERRRGCEAPGSGALRENCFAGFHRSIHPPPPCPPAPALCPPPPPPTPP